MKKNVLWAVVLAVVLIYLAQSPGGKQTLTITSDDDSSFANLVNAELTFLGQNKYESGSALSTEYARVLGGGIDFGSVSLNSGQIGVTPLEDYKLIFFMNESIPSLDYYVDIQEHEAKVQDSPDTVVGKGCEIDDDPRIVVRTVGGYPQTPTTNAQAFSAAQVREMEIDVKVHSDKCYGTPGAPRGNAICFDYDTTYFSSIETNTKTVAVPHELSTLGLGTLRCFEFDLLEDGDVHTLSVKITSLADPTPAHNISVFTDDIGFDLRKSNLEEIWDFSDEEGNQLARVVNGTADGIIYVS